MSCRAHWLNIWELYVCPCVPYTMVIEPWLMLASLGGTDHSSIQTSYNYRRAATLETPLCSRTRFIETLMLTKYSPCICHLCMWYGCNLILSETDCQMYCLWGLPEGTKSAIAYALPEATPHKLQSDLQMAAIFVGLGSAQKSQSCESTQAAVSAGPGTS